MKIGILITSISNFGKAGFYNSQEVGLAKALSPKCAEVMIYKLLPMSEASRTEKVEGFPNVTLCLIPTKNFGINGKLDTRILNDDLSVLLHFSDTQFSVPRASAWCKKHGVQYLPYIGVTESHSTGRLKRMITNVMFLRNLRVYKRSECLVKTPAVKDVLQKKGVHRITLSPVGLDESLLYSDWESASPIALKHEFGFEGENRVLLFVGRMTEEKRPIEMMNIFSELYQENHSYRLLMIGNGVLLEEVQQKAADLCISHAVRFLESLPNHEMWKVYRMADAFINLNRQEIFGMAILEAMYYGCKVVAYHAPGPDFIIEDGVSGYLAETQQALLKAVSEKPCVSAQAHRRIAEHFTWEKMATNVQKLLCGRE